LRRPNRLPASILRSYSKAVNGVIARLVLDGVLAIRDSTGFVSGADAVHLILNRPPIVSPESHTAELSIDALRYGVHLTHLDAQRLAERLYRFNSIPARDHWRRYLASHEETIPPAFSSTEWSARELAKNSPWRCWDRVSDGSRTRSTRVRYKLYVSPTCERIDLLLRQVIATTVGSPAIALKVGRAPHGLLRPDKCVLYFNRKHELLETAARLRVALVGATAQAVPFTCAITTDGLLSWGIDDASADSSWRSWISHRLASALRVWSRASTADVAGWQFALIRLAVEGVDPRTFAPTQAYVSALSTRDR
jgi:hypothetical protein